VREVKPGVQLYSASCTLPNGHHSIVITSEQGDRFNVTFSIGVRTPPLTEYHYDDTTPQSLTLVLSCAGVWAFLVFIGTTVGLIVRRQPSRLPFLREWYRWYYEGALRPDFSFFKVLLAFLLIFVSPGFRFAQVAHGSLVLLFYLVLLWCVVGVPCWFMMGEAPVVLVCFGFWVQGRYFTDHITALYRSVDLFGLFPVVVFAGVNSYEAWSCAVFGNIVLLGVLLGAVCFLGWRFLFEETFEEHGLTTAFTHVFDFIIAPVIVAAWAIVVAVVGMTRKAPPEDREPVMRATLVPTESL
jgi:hypothetical protein